MRVRKVKRSLIRMAGWDWDSSDSERAPSVFARYLQLESCWWLIDARAGREWILLLSLPRRCSRKKWDAFRIPPRIDASACIRCWRTTLNDGINIHNLGLQVRNNFAMLIFLCLRIIFSNLRLSEHPMNPSECDLHPVAGFKYFERFRPFRSFLMTDSLSKMLPPEMELLYKC